MADDLIQQLLAQAYGEGYESPAAFNYRNDPYGELAPHPTTADALRRMRVPTGAEPLRDLSSAIPVNTEHGVSLLNMARGASNSSANWLDWKPEVGPDTLAPLGTASSGR